MTEPFTPEQEACVLEIVAGLGTLARCSIGRNVRLLVGEAGPDAFSAVSSEAVLQRFPRNAPSGERHAE